MQTQDNVKEMVRQKYDEIALQGKDANQSSCCGSGCCSTDVYNIMTDDYSQIEGYNPDADLGLGCGLPTQFAKIKNGDVVIDLGSGAGNDAFIARHETGETGKVIGVDFTPAMIERARQNAAKMIVCLRNIWFAVVKDKEKMSHHKRTIQGQVVMLVFSLVSAKRAFGQCRRL